MNFISHQILIKHTDDLIPICTTILGLDRPLALPEPEPTLPFDLSLSEPTYLHRPDLYLHFRPF